MRLVDRRTPVDRRTFLKGAAAAAPAAALASRVTSEAWAEGAQALTPHSLKTLVLMARDIYPHDQLSDQYYRTAILPWDAKAAADAGTRTLLEEGVAGLDAAAKAQHGKPYLDVGWEDDRVPLLRGIETGEFFKKIRADLVVSLYNQKPLWRKLGYEGSSAEHGGYLERGFNDIDWVDKV
ncbi:gluconate 2-dehydrogenase subunit 3 family protein [Methylobacterium mesophilicum SR1.6/6]|uniref:Gluconate 2-dehydrogenase subunit 3 family protein n=1 Tax=Methylobacterium mesophilicum SR1.6/6 TaxID=908290 RepID=A0A6B9FMD7_9HYPH|nr:twin-arginine translocation signal domain-containing protein [Methylobacterium mesophilicum]QGY03703.1 gluconate 2-dehydrogenase subunit 3 family protein [Methylobacterium mesophilicum SR1.6/6]